MACARRKNNLSRTLIDEISLRNFIMVCSNVSKLETTRVISRYLWQLELLDQVIYIPLCCKEFRYRISSRRLRSHPFLKGCMIQGDIHFFAESDCPDEYNITSRSLRCLCSYVTAIRHFKTTLKLWVKNGRSRRTMGSLAGLQHSARSSREKKTTWWKIIKWSIIPVPTGLEFSTRNCLGAQ